MRINFLVCGCCVLRMCASCGHGFLGGGNFVHADGESGSTCLFVDVAC